MFSLASLPPLSLAFLFIFLPLSIIATTLSPARARHMTLLVISIIYLLLISPLAAVVLIIFTALTYLAARYIEISREKSPSPRAIVTFAVLSFLEIVAALVTRLPVVLDFFGNNYLLAMVLSIFLLQSLGYCQRVYRGIMPAAHSFSAIAGYLLFFPTLLIGPVSSYAPSEMPLARPTAEHLGRGLMRTIVGVSKLLLIASPLHELFTTYIVVSSRDISMGMMWLLAFAQLLELWYIFSGLSDIAIGVAGCFGKKMPENFAPRLFFPTLTDTLHHTARTIFAWFSEHLGAHIAQKNRFLRALAFAVTVIAATLFFHFTLPALIAAIAVSLILIIESYLPEKKHHSPIRYLVTLLLLCPIAVLFTAPDFSSAVESLQAMIGLHGATLTDSDITLARGYFFIALIAVLFATPFLRNIFERLMHRKSLTFLRAPLTFLGVLLLAIVDCRALLA